MKLHSYPAALTLLVLIPSTSTWSQGVDDAEPVSCLSLSRIDRTEVIDEYTIAFFLRGGDVYINRMSRACNGLDDNKPISYRTSTSRLCSVDTITVLENFGGRLTRGAACGLGMFVPSDEETVEMLTQQEFGDDPLVTIEEIEVEELDIDDSEVEATESDE
jgi:hypothetical protein